MIKFCFFYSVCSALSISCISPTEKCWIGILFIKLYIKDFATIDELLLRDYVSNTYLNIRKNLFKNRTLQILYFSIERLIRYSIRLIPQWNILHNFKIVCYLLKTNQAICCQFHWFKPDISLLHYRYFLKKRLFEHCWHYNKLSSFILKRKMALVNQY